MREKGLTIGAYYLAPYASTAEHVRDMALCGIDVVMNMRNDRAALDLLAENGVGAIVSGIVPGWFGGDGSNAGTMADKNPLEKYEAAAESFVDHPAIVGIDAGDEPSSLDFAHYGKAIDLIHARFPGKEAYLNIYPSYAVKGSNTPEEIVRQLGTDSYREYIRRYVERVNTSYICFDYYLYSANVPGLYESLETVAQACREHGRSMWMVLQVNSQDPEVFISEDQLRSQANTALAFGARRVIWACYCPGWWHNHVLDRQGNKTQQYDKLRRVNRQLHRIGQFCMDYRHVQTHFVGGFTEAELSRTEAAAVREVNTKGFRHLQAGGAKILAGQMEDMNGTAGEALYIAPAEDPMTGCGQPLRVTFESDWNLHAEGMDGALTVQRQADGTCVLEAPAGQGVLLMAQME